MKGRVPSAVDECIAAQPGACSEGALARSVTCFRWVLVPKPGRKEARAHLARRIAGDRTLARPRECLVHMGGFQYPETAHVLLSLGAWPIGDLHRTIRLPPQRLCVAGRGNSASELPHTGSNQFAVERVDLLDHHIGFGGRVEVVGKVVSNQ